MYLYEIIYSFDGTKKWTVVQAETPKLAVEKLYAHVGDNNIQILLVAETFAADASALIQ